MCLMPQRATRPTDRTPDHGVSWRQLQHTVRATQVQMELQRQATVTDRYTRAVDQLASTDETIRVGAIHDSGPAPAARYAKIGTTSWKLCRSWGGPGYSFGVTRATRRRLASTKRTAPTASTPAPAAASRATWPPVTGRLPPPADAPPLPVPPPVPPAPGRSTSMRALLSAAFFSVPGWLTTTSPSAPTSA